MPIQVCKEHDSNEKIAIMKILSTALVLVFTFLCVTVEAQQSEITVFMKQGGWCWYQDPRAIIHDDKLFVGSIQGNGSGDAVVGIYDLAQRMPLGRIVMHENFGHDDHNSPVFYRRPDGSVLAVYALHNRNKNHYYRVSDPKNPLVWSEEMVYRHDYAEASNVTYMNLFAMQKEGKLYNFFRGIEFNPCFITSSDQGTTWSEPTHFIKSELNGRHRPYVRYCGNGVDSVYISFTDGHPRDFGNSIYYALFKNGNFYHADGSIIKNLKTNGPLRASEAERIYTGGGGSGRGVNRSASNSAWTSCLAVDSKGHPHIAYTLYISNTDHRYRIASYDGNHWVDREVARAGNCLYDRETSYTGLISLDPNDPTCVVISSDVDPSSGIGTGGNHEIYRATIETDDNIQTIRWEPVTQKSDVGNIRPLVVRDGNTRVIAWLRGQFNTYQDYQMDVVGIVETH